MMRSLLSRKVVPMDAPKPVALAAPVNLLSSEKLMRGVAVLGPGVVSGVLVGAAEERKGREEEEEE